MNFTYPDWYVYHYETISTIAYVGLFLAVSLWVIGMLRSRGLLNDMNNDEEK